MFDDDENKPDSDSSSSEDSSSSSSSESEPAPSEESSSASVEGSEPPPAGDETEPAPAGESSPSEDESNKPLEDNEGHSDSSAETESSDISSSDSKSSSSDDNSSSDSSSSSSSDSSSGDKSVQPPSEDDVSSALTRALEDHNVPMDDSVKVTTSGDVYHLAVRLSSSFNPLPQVHDDTQSLQDGSVQGAAYLLQGVVQIIGDQIRVTMRIVSVETSAILQQSLADASGSVLDAITGAAGDALAGLPALNAS
jgi:hypothetical protein